ncbi:MAG TPA: hypothetical protein VFZ72_06325 [Jiangellaceae bacterium]
MASTGIRRRLRSLLYVGLLTAASIGATLPASAGQLDPMVEVGSPAGLAPNARSVSVELTVLCPENRTVEQAGVSVVQPQASGRVALPVLCDGRARFVTVDVPSDGGEFITGSAHVSAVLAVRQGRAKEVRDSAQVSVEPLVKVTVASEARLDGGGEAVLVDVTAACPASSAGQLSDVSVFKYPANGTGTFTPTCDGRPHTVTVTVPAANGSFGVGSGFASSTVRIQEDGVAYSGVDFHSVEIRPG